MRTSPESRYINNLDRPTDSEIERKGLLAEELIIKTMNSNLRGIETRLSTASEDSGVQDIGQRQIIDAVSYKEGHPIMGIQITTAKDPKIRQKKMKEIMDQPFLRLQEMQATDTAIPKVLVYVDREKIDKLSNSPELANDPEVILQILDGVIKSLQFDLMKTKNPLEQKAINELISQLTDEQKKHLH